MEPICPSGEEGSDKDRARFHERMINSEKRGKHNRLYY